MPAPITGSGSILMQPGTKEDFYAEHFSSETPALSELWGNDISGMQLTASSIRFPALLSRLHNSGSRASNEIIPSDRRQSTAGTDEVEVMNEVWLEAQFATYAAEVLSDLPVDAYGGVGKQVAALRMSAAQRQRRLTERGARKAMSWDILGGDRTGARAVVDAGVAIAGTQFTARRAAAFADSGNRGAYCMNRGSRFILTDGSGVMRGAQGYRVTDVAVGAHGAHDTVTFTPALDAAIFADDLVVEGDAQSDSFGDGFYSFDEVIGDATNSVDLYGQSRVTNPELNAAVLRAAAWRRLDLDLLDELFQIIRAQGDVEEGYKYVVLTTPGIWRDVYTGRATVRGGGAIGVGQQPIADVTQYAPTPRPMWGFAAMDWLVPNAPGNRVTVLTDSDFRRNTLMAMPKQCLHKFIYKKPGWLKGTLLDGTGNRVDRRLQGVSAWYTIATHIISNVRACGRIDHLFDTETRVAQG